jgi:hypothetical protein
MTVLDPNILNPFTLLDQSIAPILSLLATVVSISFSFVISWYFFRSYRLSGFGYLLGLPVGFVVIAISFIFEHLSLIYANDSSWYPVFFWIQLTLQSEALALIALSYRFKNRSADYNNDYTDNLIVPKRLQINASIRVREILSDSLPILMVAVPFTVPMSELVLGPNFNYSGLADLSFFIRVYNLGILGYIFTSAIVSLVKAANIKLLHIPAAFALLWLEQYSLMITYFDNSVIAFIGSTIARLTGLGLFSYAMYTATLRWRRKMEIGTREKT